MSNTVPNTTTTGTDDDDKKPDINPPEGVVDNPDGDNPDGNPPEDERGAIDKGMFNFQNIMDEFYNYEPEKDDSEGRAIKNSFMSNMIQSGFDSQLAKEMAHAQSGIAKSNMTHAADLEARNTSANMQQEFNYGMQSMGAQYEYQNKFADNQFDRDLGTLAATGEQNRLQLGAQGAQDRLTAVVQGEQERENTKLTTKSQEQIAATQADASKYGADKSAEASMYGADAQIRGITETGKQTRETMSHEDNVAAKKEDRQAARSRTMARSF